MTQSNHDRRDVLQRALIELKHLRARGDAQERASREPIAVVGLGCRLPGGANDPALYWNLLRDGSDVVGDVPATRWDVDAFFDANPDAPGKSYTRRGGFLDIPLDAFDALFFDIPPREAVKMDPQHRLLLEVAWEALESAGIAPTGLVGSQTGVFVGISNNDYVQRCLLGSDLGTIDAYVGTGNALNCAAGRLAFVLGLQGPALAVDTACSSSLVAVHLACQSLRTGEIELALVGGVNLILSPEVNIALSKARMLAADGRCKTFAAAADGYGRGEGCGVVVLKRLSRALEDHNTILASIRGSAVNQNGASSGLTVPSGQAQQALIRAALTNAAMQPSDVDYVEAHGTGTSLGDPIEVRALAAALADGRSEESPLAIGSVKSNIGHLESAAGIAGLIKVVLSMQHGEIPPHVLDGPLNPHVAWDTLPVVIPTSRTPWPAGKHPRVAGVSSFGFSGTNAHVIVEGGPPLETAPSASRAKHLLTLSARNDQALGALAARLADYLRTAPADSIEDVCGTLNASRSSLEHRAALVGVSAEDFSDKLGTLASGASAPGVALGHTRGTTCPPVAFLFTGQGSQWVGMGRQLFDTQPQFRATLERCDEFLRPHLERRLLSVMLGRDGDDWLLDETAYTQPALFALEYALAELWRSWGIEPSLVLGHSVGEYAAACVAGVFGLDDGLKLVAHRARLMQSLPRHGAMAAVFADESRVAAAVLKNGGAVAVAALNASDETVISGHRDAVRAVRSELERDGIASRELNVSHAFHSPLMDPIVDEFREVAASVSYARPRIGVVSNVSGLVAGGDDLVHADYWVRHLRQPVRFMQSMHELHRRGSRLLIEIGPGAALVALGQRCLSDVDAVWLASLRKGVDDWQQMFVSLAQLYTRGASVDWTAVDGPYARRHVALPTYPFQRQQYWVQPAGPTLVKHAGLLSRTTATPGGLPSLLGRRVPSPLRQVQFELELGMDSLGLLAQHTAYGHAIVPGVVYLQMAMLAASEVLKTESSGVEDLALIEPLVIAENGTRTLQLVLDPGEPGRTPFEIHSHWPGDIWRTHVRGVLRHQTEERLPPQRVNLSAIRQDCPAELASDEFYRRVWSEDFVLGPDLQLVEHLWCGDGQALGHLRRPPVATCYEIDPDLLVLDACVQLLIAALPRGGQRDDRGSLYVGTGQRVSKVYRRLPDSPVWCRAVITHSDPAAGVLVGDLRVCDDDGAVLAELCGVELKRLRAETLARVARDSTASARQQPAQLSRTQLMALDDQQRQPALEQYLAESVARITGLTPSQLDPQQPLLPLLDSLMAIEFKSQLELELECTIPMTVLLGGGSVRELADYLLASGLPTATDTEVLSDLVAELESLSDEEALLRLVGVDAAIYPSA